MKLYSHLPKMLTLGFLLLLAPFKDAALAQGPTSLITEMGTLSPNLGHYSNVVPRIEPSSAFTEVCFKGGSMVSDLHSTGETTNGGNCAPGDLGWIIEKYERESECWHVAKSICLQENMRLPETFEYQISCDNAAAFGLSYMSGNYEWASNSAFPIADSVRGSGIGSTIIGNLGCGNGTWDWAARSDANQCDPRPFRCAR